MYIAYFIVKEVTYDSNTALFMGSIDLMIVTLTAFILSLMISKKEDDFFVIKDQKST